MRNLIAFGVSLWLLLAATAGAEVIYVDAASPSDPGSGTHEDPYRTIQAGLDGAAIGDTVLVRPGVYSGPGNRDLLAAVSVTVTSEDPNNPAVVETTVVDPQAAGRGFVVSANPGSPLRIIGLTIRNASTSGSGAAVLCQGGELDMEDCVLEDNQAGLYGGGVFCYSGTVRLERCVVRGNGAGDGGGVGCENGVAELVNCVVAGNSAGVHGGGFDGYSAGDFVLTNCTVVGNTADTGGAVCLRGSDMTVGNSIFLGSEASLANELAVLSLQHGSMASVVELQYSNVPQGDPNVSVDPGCSVVRGAGVIDVEAGFAQFDPGTLPSTWDLHLQSTAGRWAGGWVSDAVDSACLDMGDPGDSVGEEPWPHGGRVNMGAYGGTAEASRSGNVADLNIDGRVDLTDLAVMSLGWLGSGPMGQNLAGAEQLNQLDYAVFGANWLWQKP